MGYVVSLGRGEAYQEGERGSGPDREALRTLEGVPSSVVAALLADGPDAQQVVEAARGREAAREIAKQRRYAEALAWEGGTIAVLRASERAQAWLARAIRDDDWGGFAPLPEEALVLLRLRAACPDDPEKSLREHGFLDTNEHAVLHNLFLRVALHELESGRKGGTGDDAGTPGDGVAAGSAADDRRQENAPSLAA